MLGKFYLSSQSGVVVLLSQLTDKETKAQRSCVAEWVTGRAWTPALVILGGRGALPPPSPFLFTSCLSRNPCSSELKGCPGLPFLSDLHTFFLSQSSPHQISASDQRFGAGGAGARQ